MNGRGFLSWSVLHHLPQIIYVWRQHPTIAQPIQADFKLRLILNQTLAQLPWWRRCPTKCRRARPTRPRSPNKLEVIDYWESLPQQCPRKERACMLQFPETLRGRGMLGRWRKACNRFKWRSLPVEVQRRCKEIPNWLRPACAAESQKGPVVENHMPNDIMQATGTEGTTVDA